MKITIFGASGKTGQLVLQNALGKDHLVTAFVRHKNAISITHPNLKIVFGNLNDEAKVSEAIDGSEVCISTLGGNSLRKHATEITSGIELLITLMERQKVSRLIYLSSFGVGESRNYMSGLIRIIILDLFLRIPIADHNINEQSIKNSGLNWTILRPGGLTEGPETGYIKYGEEKPGIKGNPKISRANVAAFIMEKLSDKSMHNKAVWLGE